MVGFCREFLVRVAETAILLSESVAVQESLSCMVTRLAWVRKDGGRLFLLGVGGSAGNCSHAVNDFRKLCEIEAYAPTDNPSELTARANDEGMDTVFTGFLRGSRLSPKDAILILSVGGGNVEKQVSVCLTKAINLAREAGAGVLGIVGRPDGYTAKMADACVIVPATNPAWVTPLSEAFQAVIWHMIVTHPTLAVNPTKW